MPVLSDHDLSEYFYSSRLKNVIPFSRDFARCHIFPMWINLLYTSLVQQAIFTCPDSICVENVCFVQCKLKKKNVYFKLFDFLGIGSLRLSTCLTLYLSGWLPDWISAVITNFGHVICHIIFCDQGITTPSVDLITANSLYRWLNILNTKRF